MAYFLIVPAFILWLLIAAATIYATRTIPRLAAGYPYAMRISVWATVGFIIANSVLIGLLGFGFVALDSLVPSPSTTRDVLQVAWALTAIGGPIVASALGWIAGCILGAVLAFRRSRRLPPNSSFNPNALTRAG
jgi:hypothetical protein